MGAFSLIICWLLVGIFGFFEALPFILLFSIPYFVAFYLPISDMVAEEIAKNNIVKFEKLWILVRKILNEKINVEFETIKISVEADYKIRIFEWRQKYNRNLEEWLEKHRKKLEKLESAQNLRLGIKKLNSTESIVWNVLGSLHPEIQGVLQQRQAFIETQVRG